MIESVLAKAKEIDGHYLLELMALVPQIHSLMHELLTGDVVHVKLGHQELFMRRIFVGVPVGCVRELNNPNFKSYYSHTSGEIDYHMIDLPPDHPLEQLRLKCPQSLWDLVGDVKKD